MRVLLCLFALASTAAAQWPDVPDVNLPICDASGEQAIPKIAAAGDGGCYVSWFDNRSGGYDVYAQRIDAAGNTLWKDDGVLIANRNYSSTMDFDLIVDAAGNAVVAYRNAVFGGDGILVSSIAASGSLNWTTVVQGGGTFVASPVLAASEDAIMVGWISGEDSKFQRLNQKGQALWLQPLVVSDPAGGTLMVSDMEPSLDGSVLASFVQYTTFWGTKLLFAQRIGSGGAAVWDELAPVMSTNSLQMGAFPDFIGDGQGGGFFTWYGVGPLQVYASRVVADGSVTYEVQVASSLGSTQRVDPVAVRDGSELIVFFRTLDNGQNNHGISVQRLTAGGSLLWGSAGVMLLPTSVAPQYGPFAAHQSDVSAVFYGQSASFGDDIINRMAVDGSGGIIAATPVSSWSSTMGRIVAAPADGGVVLAWSDDRGGGKDIYGQRVNSDGSLGPPMSDCEGDVDGDGVVGVSDVLAAIADWGVCVDCPADINGDGVVDVSDLLLIIGAWGPC